MEKEREVGGNPARLQGVWRESHLHRGIGPGSPTSEAHKASTKVISLGIMENAGTT